MAPTPDTPPRRRRRPFWQPEVPDLLLVFAVGLLVAGNVSGPNPGDLYAGMGALGLWVTMRAEWRRNRRDDEGKGGGRS